MSLEDAVHRLVNVIGTTDNTAAVKEIIRQRDEALENARRNEANWKWADERREKYWRELETERRRSRSLRAYIKRMKTK